MPLLLQTIRKGVTGFCLFKILTCHCLSTFVNRGKANFFERRVADYQKASIMSNLKDGTKNFVFKLDEDF